MKMSLMITIVVVILAIILTLILLSFQKSDDTDYRPLPKEWQSSGPFQIDRNEYAIGEKIFIVVEGLKSLDKGQISIMRPLNTTHYSIWGTIPFDGNIKSEFSFYVEPKISKIDGICSVDDMIGEWLMFFNGTNYPVLDFDFTKRVVPGINIEPVC